ncbi:hypothetical protein SUGI_1128470 [Cryptomeria japonica]|uniref:uncharacterized protein LOC131065334 n=1 Tax=Cryptomeria japonica TaxID=3369 RepID=UPI0024146C9D|nr:uncharacterized protein LOC131065334 [Cryptomeria japonica]GLJ52980.1 hypothetical protein SUGI_1128470 [Cryptomeria japonica]
MERGAGNHHKFILYRDLPLYKYRRCREYGANYGFKCNNTNNSNCQFVLHQGCAQLSKILLAPVYSPRKFALQAKSEREMYTCTAREKPIKGLFYRESDHPHMRLHPLCIKLPSQVDSPAHPHPLVLSSARGRYTCMHCNKLRNREWRYECENSACKFVLDLHCAKREIYGIPKTRRDTSNVIRVTTLTVLRLVGICVPFVGGGVGEVVPGDAGQIDDTACQAAGVVAQVAEHATHNVNENGNQNNFHENSL